ncbi:MAG: aspartyl protease family protein [Terracidiphilus sp.]|jgi:predicted aspartyl protease
MKHWTAILIVLASIPILPICSASEPSSVDFEMPPSGKVVVAAQGGVQFDAMINGKGPFRLVFDSGAGANFLIPSVARQLGLIEEGPVIQAIGTAPVPVRAARVSSVAIGDLLLHDQHFLILPMPWGDGSGPVGAVGFEIMRRLVVTVDYQREQLSFNLPQGFRYTGNGVKVPIDSIRSPLQIEVEGSVNGASGLFCIDTGDEGSLELEQRFVSQYDLVKELSPKYHGYAGSGIGGAMPPAYYSRVKSLRIGEAEVTNVLADLFDGQALSEENSGNIGTRVLRQFTLTFDLPHGVMYLEKNSNWGRPEVFNRAGMIIDSVQRDQKVMNVLPGSPAALAGVEIGDVLLRIDGRAPSDNPLLQDDPAFWQAVGTVVHLTVRHGDQVRKVKIKLKELL